MSRGTLLLNDAARVGPTLRKKSLNFSAMIVLSEMICPSVTIDFMLFRRLRFLLSISDVIPQVFLISDL